jgi:LacI family transcriptional regulator
MEGLQSADRDLESFELVNRSSGTVGASSRGCQRLPGGWSRGAISAALDKFPKLGSNRRYAGGVQPAGSRTTLSSVAAAAGVSLATVSKVVNDRHDVAPATRERVRRLLEQHNYSRPGRRRGRSRSVGLVMRALDSEWAVEIIRGVTGSDLDIVVSTMPAGAAAATWAEDTAASGRAGVIVVTSQFTSAQKRVFQRAGIPCVVIDPVDLPDPDVPSVGATNWGGGLAATRHLTQLGHRRIAVIGGPAGVLCGRARIDGYRAALDAAGLPFDPASALLALPDRPTAVFAGSDEQAFGAIEAARVAGLVVPRDLSVVGFDDLPIARWAAPPLTTVRQPLAEMGRVATQLLEALIAGRDPDAYHVELATALVVRASTAPPRSRR